MQKPLFLPQRYLQRRNEVVHPLKSSKGRREWIISRSLCHYQLISLEDVPLARRENVLQLKIRQWSPFKEYGSYPVWYSHGQVQVWIWDKQFQNEQIKQLNLKKVVAIPETLLRSRPSVDIIRLVNCLEGVEAQIWQRGLLIASRWWAQIPTIAEWTQFQRTHSLPIQTEIPQVIDLPLLPRAWGRPRTNVVRLGAAQEATVISVIIGLLIVIFTWQGVNLWQWYQVTQQIQRQIEQSTEQIEPILQARTQALNYKQQAEEILQLNAYPSQLEILHRVLENLPHDENTKLLEWLYQWGELRITVETNKLDPTFYVKTFQALDLFTDVNAEIGSGRNANQILISMQLVKTL